MIRTYQTRLWNNSVLENKTTFQFLQEIAALFGRIERRLFVDLSIRKRSVNKVKKEYQTKYGINARQFNSYANTDCSNSVFFKWSTLR